MTCFFPRRGTGQPSGVRLATERCTPFIDVELALQHIENSSFFDPHFFPQTSFLIFAKTEQRDGCENVQDYFLGLDWMDRHESIPYSSGIPMSPTTYGSSRVSRISRIRTSIASLRLKVAEIATSASRRPWTCVQRDSRPGKSSSTIFGARCGACSMRQNLLNFRM